MAETMDLYWVGTSLDDLKKFPIEVVQIAGYQLHMIQSGIEPSNWKPMKTVGQGVREIRIRVSKNAYRVFYVLVKNDGVYVLHAFQKTTKTTPHGDINLAKRRYNEVMRKK
ncbi:MAG: type II toxin-antitoxin system RelE/ParE family toxin [Gammaproteobacteria bacterium]